MLHVAQPGPHARDAESIGRRRIRVDRSEQIGPAWDQAFRSDRPVLVEAVTVPEVPPLPAHITFKQAKAFASSLLRLDPDWPAMLRQTCRDMIENWIPHKG